MNYTMTASKRLASIVLALAVAFAFGCVPALVTNTTAAHASTASQLKSTCTKIVKSKAKSGAYKTKLRNLAKYVENNSGYANLYQMEKTVSVKKLTKATAKKYALHFLKQKKGSCYHYALGFAYLAKKACPKAAVRVGYSSKTVVMPGSKTAQDHAWTEVKLAGKWYVYDTDMDDFYAGTNNKYAGKYIGKTRASLKSLYKNYKNAKYFTVSF